MKNNTELPLRIGVGVILLNQEKKVFVGKRIDNPSNHWQMPQGGVDENENFLEAAKRELMEETSVKSVKLITEIDGWLTYNLPKNLLIRIIFLLAKKAKQENRTKKAKISNEAIKKEYKFSLIM